MGPEATVWADLDPLHGRGHPFIPSTSWKLGGRRASSRTQKHGPGKEELSLPPLKAWRIRFLFLPAGAGGNCPPPFLPGYSSKKRIAHIQKDGEFFSPSW
jgi:hypothetical protein